MYMYIVTVHSGDNLFLNVTCHWSGTFYTLFPTIFKVIIFLFQKSRKQPSILNYFSEISSLDDEVANDMLAGIDFEESEIFEKRQKLH